MGLSLQDFLDRMGKSRSPLHVVAKDARVVAAEWQQDLTVLDVEGMIHPAAAKAFEESIGNALHRTTVNWCKHVPDGTVLIVGADDPTVPCLPRDNVRGSRSLADASGILPYTDEEVAAMDLTDPDTRIVLARVNVSRQSGLRDRFISILCDYIMRVHGSRLRVVVSTADGRRDSSCAKIKALIDTATDTLPPRFREQDVTGPHLVRWLCVTHVETVFPEMAAVEPTHRRPFRVWFDANKDTDTMMCIGLTLPPDHGFHSRWCADNKKGHVVDVNALYEHVAASHPKYKPAVVWTSFWFCAMALLGCDYRKNDTVNPGVNAASVRRSLADRQFPVCVSLDRVRARVCMRIAPLFAFVKHHADRKKYAAVNAARTIARAAWALMHYAGLFPRWDGLDFGRVAAIVPRWWQLDLQSTLPIPTTDAMWFAAHHTQYTISPVLVFFDTSKLEVLSVSRYYSESALQTLLDAETGMIGDGPVVPVTWQPSNVPDGREMRVYIYSVRLLNACDRESYQFDIANDVHLLFSEGASSLRFLNVPPPDIPAEVSSRSLICRDDRSRTTTLQPSATLLVTAGGLVRVHGP